MGKYADFPFHKSVDCHRSLVPGAPESGRTLMGPAWSQTQGTIVSAELFDGVRALLTTENDALQSHGAPNLGITMDAQRFKRLKIDLAHCARLPANDPFIETGALKINEIDALLFYDEEFDPDRLQIRFDLGKLPDKVDALLPLTLALLSVNFIFGLGGLAVFGINVNNEHIVLTTQHILSDSVSAQDLFSLLQEAAYKANQAWQEVQNPNSPSMVKSFQ